MAGDEGDVVPERPELLADRPDEQLVIAARQVRAPDRAPEQHVADDGAADPLLAMERELEVLLDEYEWPPPRSVRFRVHSGH